MNTEINKQISQFLDDDLDSLELQKLLKKVSSEPELKNKLDRYQAISLALKTDSFVIPKAGFLEEINHQIQKEPHLLVAPKPIKKATVFNWQKTTLALAASIALVAVLATQQSNQQIVEPIQSASLKTEPQTSKKVQVKSPQQNITLVAQKQPSEEVMLLPANKSKLSQHERLKAYLQAHSDDLYTHGSINFQPLGQVASYQRD